MSAGLSYLPFVNKEVQAKARAMDPSIPEFPSSTAQLVLKLRTDVGSEILVGLQSSFVGAEQERLVQFALAPKDNPGKLAYVGHFRFDTPDDKLLLFAPGKKEPIVDQIFPGKNKDRDEVQAFLNVCGGGIRDPRLTDFEAAASLVKLTEDAIHASEL